MDLVGVVALSVPVAKRRCLRSYSFTCIVARLPSLVAVSPSSCPAALARRKSGMRGVLSRSVKSDSSRGSVRQGDGDAAFAT